MQINEKISHTERNIEQMLHYLYWFDEFHVSSHISNWFYFRLLGGGMLFKRTKYGAALFLLSLIIYAHINRLKCALKWWRCRDIANKIQQQKSHKIYSAIWIPVTADKNLSFWRKEIGTLKNCMDFIWLKLFHIPWCEFAYFWSISSIASFQLASFSVGGPVCKKSWHIILLAISDCLRN